MSTTKILSIAAASAIMITGLSALEILEDATGAGFVPKGTYIGGRDVNVGNGSDELNISDQYNTLGEVLNSNGDIASYNELLDAGALVKSRDLRGDALVYPFFRHTDGWGTEITVRNTTPRATVAKAVLYRNDNSMEMIDFNIYLSPFDSATFTIKDNKITTSDRSFAGRVTSPALGRKKDKANMVDGSEYVINGWEGNGYITPDGEKSKISDKGYVVIYGMTQYDDGSTASDFEFGSLQYHRTKDDLDAHARLWKDYRSLLDACRTVYKTKDGKFVTDNEGNKIIVSWRDSYKYGEFNFGSMDGTNRGVHYRSPNVKPYCADNEYITEMLKRDEKKLPYSLGSLNFELEKLSHFGDVMEDTLTGTVRIYKDEKEQSRDLRLPATALRNFTSNQMLLWTEGEWAAIQDRRLLPDGDYQDADYNVEGIRIDARSAFYTRGSYFTFEKDPDNKKVQNKLIVTQPMKRTLNSLWRNKADSFYWEHFGDTPREDFNCLSKPDINKEGFYSPAQGGFNINNWVVDNDELIADDKEITVMAPITSPYTVVLTPYSINCEVAELGDEYFQRDENIEDKTYSYDKDGFAYVNFTRGGQASGLPAIVTQMTGSKVGGVAQTNWIYAPTIK